MKFALILLLYTCNVSSEFIKTINKSLSIKKDTNKFGNEYIINNNFDVVSHLKVPVNISGDNQNNVELISDNSNRNENDILNDDEEFPQPAPARSYLENYIENERCCVVVHPPKCDICNCTVTRKRECGDICTQDVVVLDSPFFPGINYTEFLPSTNLTNGTFEETIILPKLAEMNSTSITGFSPNTPIVFPWRINRDYLGRKLNKTVFPANPFPHNFQPFPFPQQNFPLPPENWPPPPQFFPWFPSPHPPQQTNTTQNTTSFLPPQQFPFNWYPFKPLGGKNESFPTLNDPLVFPVVLPPLPPPYPMNYTQYQYQQQPVYGLPSQPLPPQQWYG